MEKLYLLRKKLTNICLERFQFYVAYVYSNYPLTANDIESVFNEIQEFSKENFSCIILLLEISPDDEESVEAREKLIKFYVI